MHIFVARSSSLWLQFISNSVVVTNATALFTVEIFFILPRYSLFIRGTFPSVRRFQRDFTDRPLCYISVHTFQRITLDSAYSTNSCRFFGTFTDNISAELFIPTVQRFDEWSAESILLAGDRKTSFIHRWPTAWVIIILLRRQKHPSCLSSTALLCKLRPWSIQSRGTSTTESYSSIGRVDWSDSTFLCSLTWQ